MIRVYDVEGKSVFEVRNDTSKDLIGRIMYLVDDATNTKYAIRFRPIEKMEDIVDKIGAAFVDFQRILGK